ncbi:MAG: hypothetical protein H0W46_13010 [Acidimicrobiia bacterium]|nr:hypothetical protein [Acidimicrobiia bacterium]
MKVAAILLLIALALALLGVIVKGLIWLLVIAAVLVTISVFMSRRERTSRVGRLPR